MGRKIIRNENGQMLIQAIIGIGVMSIASFFIAQLFVDQNRQIRHIEMKQEVIDLRNMLTMTFMSSSTCCPIGNSAIADFDFTQGSTTDVGINSIFNYCATATNPNPPILVGTSAGPTFKYFTVKSIILTNISQPDSTNSPSSYLAKVKVNLANKDEKGMAINSILLPISFTTSTIATEPATSTKRKVSACSNTTGEAVSTSSASSGYFTNGIQIYSTPGTYSFTVPDGVTRLKVELWGGGSPASGSVAYSNTGASGAYSMDYFDVTPGTVYPVVVAKAAGFSYTTFVTAPSTFGSLLSAGSVTLSNGTMKGGIASGRWGVNGIDSIAGVGSSYYEEGWGTHESCSPVSGPPAPNGYYKWGSGMGTCGGFPTEAQPGHAIITW